MKIKYTFVTGETTEVEVDGAIGIFILGARREEENKDRYKRKHSYSLDAIPFEDISLASLNTPKNSIVVNEEAEDFNKKLKGAEAQALLCHSVFCIDKNSYNRFKLFDYVVLISFRAMVKSMKED